MFSTYRFDFYDVPIVRSPRSGGSGGGAGAGDGFFAALPWLAVGGAYCYGYYELVSFVGLSSLPWSAVLFPGFTIALIMTLAMAVLIFDRFWGDTEADEGVPRAASATKEAVEDRGVSKQSAKHSHEEAELEYEYSDSSVEVHEASIEVKRMDSAVIVTIRGRIDRDNHQKFSNEVNRVICEDDRNVVINLRHMTYISSAGLRVLLLLFKSLVARGSSFALAAPNAGIQAILEITAFVHVFPIYGSVREAIDKGAGKSQA